MQTNILLTAFVKVTMPSTNGGATASKPSDANNNVVEDETEFKNDDDAVINEEESEESDCIKIVDALKGRSWFDAEEEYCTKMKPDIMTVAANNKFDRSITRIIFLGAIQQQSADENIGILDSLQNALSSAMFRQNNSLSSLITGGIVLLHEFNEFDEQDSHGGQSGSLFAGTKQHASQPIFGFMEGPPTYIYDILHQLKNLISTATDDTNPVSTKQIIRIILAMEDCPCCKFNQPMAIYLSASPKEMNGTSNEANWSTSTENFSAENLSRDIVTALYKEVPNFPSSAAAQHSINATTKSKIEGRVGDKNQRQDEKSLTHPSPLPVIELRVIQHRKAIPSTKQILSFCSTRTLLLGNEENDDHSSSNIPPMMLYPTLDEFLTIYTEPIYVELESECVFPPYSMSDMIDYDAIRRSME